MMTRPSELALKADGKRCKKERRSVRALFAQIKLPLSTDGAETLKNELSSDMRGPFRGDRRYEWHNFQASQSVPLVLKMF
jgi:hypothetical protein